MSLTVLEDSTSSTEEGGESGESSGYKDNDGTFGSEDISEAACPWGLVQMSPSLPLSHPGGADKKLHGVESHLRP